MDMLRFSDRFQAVLSLFSPQIGWIITVVKWVGMLRFIQLNLTGYDAQGVITSDGRVEYLLNNDTTKNGWQKLEATANASAEGKLTISLAAVGEEMQLSDVTLLENANTAGHVWTTAPTSNETTEYDLSDRATANAFSFFDRGKNRNAIIYANASTVLGMS